MYLDFFGLREEPFGVTPDPAFLYLSHTHREALEALRSDFMTDRGFMVLVGEPGLGKTTLLYKLMDEWRETSRAVFLFQTQCDTREFFRYLLAELGVDSESMGLVAMHHKLNHFFFQEMLAGRRFALMVDEAQNLSDSVLETVRLLSNFETQHAKLLNIVLAGQPQLADKLAAPGLRQLRQRIGLLNRLQPLTAPETAEYIKHRLGLVGHCGDSIFTIGALQAIAQSSQGAPRTINHICHLALCVAATKGVRTINLEMAQNAIARLDDRNSEVAPSLADASVKMPTPVPVPAPVSTPVSNPLPKSGLSVRPGPPPAVLLSYGWSRKSNSMLWGSVAIASCVLLLVGVAIAIPSVRRFAIQEYKNILSSIRSKPPDSGAASSPEFSSASDATLVANDSDHQDIDLQRGLPHHVQTEQNSVMAGIEGGASAPAGSPAALATTVDQVRHLGSQRATRANVRTLRVVSDTNSTPRSDSSMQRGAALAGRVTPEIEGAPFENTFENGMLTFHARNQALRSVLKQIGDQAGVNIYLAEGLGNEQLSIEFRHTRLDEALRQLLKGYDFYFLNGAGQDSQGATLQAVWIYPAGGAQAPHPLPQITSTTAKASAPTQVGSSPDPPAEPKKSDPVAEMLKALENPSDHIREQALSRALSATTPIPQETLVNLALADVSAKVRLMAFQALPLNTDLRWVVERATRDWDQSVSQAAREVLRQLDSRDSDDRQARHPQPPPQQ